MKTALKVVLFIVVTLVMAGARVVWSAREAYRRGAAAENATERHRHFGLAARLYAPGNPYSNAALLALADEGRHGGEEGRKAWEEVRAAILGTRSFYTPHPELLDEANQALAKALAQKELDPATPGPKVGSGSVDERTAWHLDKLNVGQSPVTGWSIFAILGLLAWIGAAWMLFEKGFSAEGKLEPRAAIFAVVIVAGLAMFYYGLLRA